MNRFLPFMFLGLLAACSTPAGQSIPTGFQQYENSKYNFVFSVPKEMRGRNTSEDDWAAFGTFSALTETPSEEDFTVNAYAGSELPAQDVPCSPSLTGTSSPIPLGSGEWGEVDAFNTRDQYGNWPEGFDFRVNNDIVCKKPLEAASVYSFCSEKDGKTVVICISQMKGDPKMAKEIFETFRWTE